MSQTLRKQKASVTILLAAYNGEKYLADQLESIIGQTYKNWRLLISDDNSKDKTLKIIKSYQRKYTDKIEILENPVSFGSAKDNFFYLINNADSDYVMLCDQDDVWLPNKIEITLKRMKQLESSSSVDYPVLVFTDLLVVNENQELIASSFMKYSNLCGKRTGLNNLLIQNIATGCTIMINKSLLRLSKKHINSETILMHDWWLSLTASAFGRLEYIKATTVKYRQHENNTLGAKNTRSIRYLLKKAFSGKDIKLSIKRTTLQAAQFLAAYGDSLNTENRKLIGGYAALYNSSKFKRLCFMIKNRVFKYGVSRKIAQIIWG